MNEFLPIFQKQKSYIVSTFEPNAISGSNAGTGWRGEHRWLA
jgi:hypothetical protein